LFTAFIILILLIVLNAFFAASEIALISLNDNKVKTMAEEGHKKAKLLQHLLSEPSRFLATIQIGITLAGFMASAFAADQFSGPFADLLYEAGVPLPIRTLDAIAVVFITIVLSYFTLVFGELVPKRLGMNKAEPIAMFAAVPLTLLLKVSAPFVKLLTVSTNSLVRLFGVDPNAQKEQVTEEEIRMMVDIGKENGAIQENEKIMINNIFELDNKTVSDIMTHRRYVVGLSVDTPLREAAELINREKFTRFPVYDENIDSIVGILHVKDLFQYIGAELVEPVELSRLMRKPFYVPESKRTDELLKEMQTNKIHLAVVVDEYGGTAGIVTIEDLLEEIVGNIYDEHDEVEKEIEKIDESTYVVNGTTSLRTVRELFDIDVPLDEYDTLSGWIIGELGKIPQTHEEVSFSCGGVEFTVSQVDEMRIAKVTVRRLPQIQHS